MTKQAHHEDVKKPLTVRLQSTLDCFTQKPSPNTLAPTKTIKKEHWTRTNYFEARQKKLVSQAPTAISVLFKRLHVYCTGVRSHSQRRLETLVWRNGGTVHKVWMRTVVTHVIADNLCASKIEKELSLTSSNRWSGVIVRPEWLLQSVKLNKLLPTWDFQIIKTPPNVKNLDVYFQNKKATCQKRTSSTTSEDPYTETI